MKTSICLGDRGPTESESPTVYVRRSAQVRGVQLPQVFCLCAGEFCTRSAVTGPSKAQWAQRACSGVCNHHNMFQVHWAWWTQTGLMSLLQRVSYVWDILVSLCMRCGMPGMLGIQKYGGLLFKARPSMSVSWQETVTEILTKESSKRKKYYLRLHSYSMTFSFSPPPPGPLPLCLLGSVHCS